MSEQYFSKQPQSKSNEKTWTFELRENKLSFTSDHGVFSKSEVDFGSRLLIQAFSAPEISGDILDLGCGYGPIGLSLAKAFPESKLVLTDINERAISLAKKNAENNDIVNVEFAISDRFEALQNRRFSAILTNPPIRAGKKIIFQMFEESYDALLSRGELWVVIQKKQGAPSTQKKLEEMFDSVEVVAKDKGYYILCAKKE
ncbi:methyltransferase [Aquibacillus halophilus]|uniref:Methyltransferase n=1 Tax=Aquibacillus halophilus TaxID=930132 RepID=A0A6A8DGL0_9BACI|nr:class I SAM-dependent methyltransferase [Aquibacillus halophilus]MRH44825.1 methyltransferase [Aquibacillus halophilus]